MVPALGEVLCLAPLDDGEGVGGRADGWEVRQAAGASSKARIAAISWLRVGVPPWRSGR